MARPSRCRKVCIEPEYNSFAPCGIPNNDNVIITVDEYEVIRLIDFERKTHEQCSKHMDISRTTVTETYERARFKIADCIVNGKALRIEGGNYKLCDGFDTQCFKTKCHKANTNSIEIKLNEKGDNKMRVAVTYDNGSIFQHFGHTEQFKVYDIENDCVVNTQIVETLGSGHGALAELLKKLSVDCLICGGIGGGAQSALNELGIKLYGGVSGDADEAVKSLVLGKLSYNPDVHCDHHEHEHSCGEHQCGEDKHGCSGN